MDYPTLATQLLGGILGAVLVAAALRRFALEYLGALVIGIVGGALGGLVATSMLGLVPAALPDGAFGPPAAIAAQAAAGAAGGALLAVLTGLLKRAVS